MAPDSSGFAAGLLLQLPEAQSLVVFQPQAAILGVQVGSQLFAGHHTVMRSEEAGVEDKRYGQLDL